MSYPGPGGPQHPQQFPPQQQYPPQYAQQPHYCNQNCQHPAGPAPGRGPWTLPGWGLIPALIGTVIALVGHLFLPYTNDMLMVGASDVYQLAIDKGVWPDTWPSHIVVFYLSWGSILLTLVTAVYMIVWTAGGVRGPVSSYLILSYKSKGLAAGKATFLRVYMCCMTVFILGCHLICGLRLQGWDPGELQSGYWAILLGMLVMAVGAAIGPRLPEVASRP